MSQFSPRQLAWLGAALGREHVRERAGLSYIEAWHAIEEANRIFGFDGWNRETLETRCVRDGLDSQGRSRIAYVCRVRITVGTIIRDGTGAGTGINIDPGLAHEKAIKEAESDAMKRALMTFGYPFGLALYDKEQRNVADHPNGNGHAHPRDHLATQALMDGGRHAATNGMNALKEWWMRLPKETRDEFTEFKDRELKPMAEKADEHITNNLAAG